MHTISGVHTDDDTAEVSGGDGGPGEEGFALITQAIAVQVIEGQHADGAGGGRACRCGCGRSRGC